MAVRSACAAFLGIFLSACPVFADGCYFPERAVQKIPAIPAQRAIVSWKDGTETLIISSALDSEAQKLGWIIPVPSVPEKIEKQTPGALKTLSFCIQPEVTHDLYRQLRLIILVATIGNILVAILLFKREWLLRYLVTLFLLLVLWSLMLPAAGALSERASMADSLQVETTAKVGSYDIAVLRPKETGDLDVWLEENGFASLPSEADGTIADYIKSGWVFAAIKLTRSEAGTNAPHPIEMTFPTKEAIYPVRLTALAGGSPAFEIFVIADQRASCGLLEEEFCDRFEKVATEEGGSAPECCKGTASKLEVGHPAIRQLMWNDCILTKLVGTVNANKMTRDIRFAWMPFQSLQKHFYTINGAEQSAWFCFAGCAGIGICLSMFVCKPRIVRPEGGLWYLGVVLLPMLALLGLGAFAYFVSLPKLAMSDIHVTRGVFRSSPHFLQYRIWDQVKDKPDVLRSTQAEIEDYLLDKLRGLEWSYPTDSSINTITGGEIAMEDSPGNFTVEKLDDKVVIRGYDRRGIAWIAEYPIDGNARESPNIHPEHR